VNVSPSPTGVVPPSSAGRLPSRVVLSFDVEEHYRIEAASHLASTSEQQATDIQRVDLSTHRLLDLLAESGAKATFYLVAPLAKSLPDLVRDIDSAGHEIASHSWAHKRIHFWTPEQFREDLKKSKQTLEDAVGKPILGFRAPTFSLMRETAWALDILAEEGFEYDSSIFPVRHDRYGIPDAPRTPFMAIGTKHRLLELPPATWNLTGQNIPVAGGGYFRLFPPALIRAGIRQLSNKTAPPVAMLYFHPWEFDPEQPRLPLSKLSSWRTYVGIDRSTSRLKDLLTRYTFHRAIDVVEELKRKEVVLSEFKL
jgi:polysaccharide deacetylase family protein (PEP-CTERM system associated)